MMQNLLVAIILALCVAYTVRRLWRRMTAHAAGDVHCAGCPLAEHCEHHHDKTASGHADSLWQEAGGGCPRQDAGRGCGCS